MSEYPKVWRDGKLVSKQEAAKSEAAFFMPDIAPFVTQDGVEITSRSALRAYEQRTGTKQVGNDWSGSERPSWWDKIPR
jgi:hypothetical protein